MTSSTDTTATDRDAFEAQVRRHARELHVHCSRMTGSMEESEDLVQETFLRAWLYRIATNACLDALDRRPRTAGPDGEVLWLQPYPDALLEELAAGEAGPEDAVVARETIELTFITAIQRLQPLPRAVFILRDVLDCSASETAELLETTVAAVNSALQRAHAGLREHLPQPRAQWRPGQEPSAAERELLARYVEAGERADTEAFGAMRCLVTRANRQPAVVCFVRRPGDPAYTPLAVDVLHIEDGRVREIVTFDAEQIARFDVPASLPA